MSNVKQFKEGTKLYAVVSNEDLHNNMLFFLNPGPAIIWSLISNTLTYPKKNATILEQILGYKKSETLNLFFNNNIKLIEVSLPQNTYIAIQVYDEEIYQNPQVIFNGSVGLFNQTVISPLFEKDFTAYDDNKISINDTFNNLLNVLSDKATKKETRTLIRFANSNTFRKDFIFKIKWDVIWQIFIILRSQNQSVEYMSKYVTENISSFINLQDVEKYVYKPLHLKTYTPPRLHPKLKFVNCFSEMKGFSNQGNSCFMDSALLAMFMFKTSPFYDNLIVKEFQRPNYGPKGKGIICFNVPFEINGVPINQQQINNLINFDFEKRSLIQKLLRMDYKQIIRGERIMCTTLRIELGRNCRGGGDDFSNQPADPSEMYRRLCNTLEYNPISYNTTTLVSKPDRDLLPDQNTVRVLSKYDQNSPTLPTLSINDQLMKRISWPSSWNETWSEIESELTNPEFKGQGYKYKRNTIYITNADCIVVEINRNMFDEQQPWMPIPGVNNRRLKVDTIMYIESLNETYHLMSVVYPPLFGHFSALLRCDEGWFHYDDSPGRTSFISEHPIEYNEAIKIIEEKGVLLFYYKIPDIDLTQYSQQRIEEVTSYLNKLEL